ncbi:helix-turn-helix domain-containing protein [Pontibacter qinzhouensis]|uniref:Helix-turn-helix domain-containing protein n=2 Tax=Pontibacter qinzhouensis TaxID=2603253 RepID=A0A5C8J4L0_9BACT|nr:helix-turn-helix domain-containing protein [Pontibacter qinzhouensis]
MRQMVEEIHRGLLNIKQAAAKFEVNRDTVKHWLDKVEQEHLSIKDKVPVKPSPRKKKASAPQPEEATAQIMELQTKLQALEQELEASKFKALYYSTLLKIAEQELGIDIEKKSATRQSGSCS